VTCDATCLITSRGHSRFGTFQIELQLECWNYLEHLNVIFRSSHAMDRFSIIIEFHLSKPVLYNPCAENLKYVLYCGTLRNRNSLIAVVDIAKIVVSK